VLHGGDYNPEQWIRTPEVWDEDVRLMKLAGCNAMSVGIFSWSMLEPAEGRYEFGWLDAVLEKLAAAGVFVILATPSAARPAWMSQKYPEVLRVRPDGGRNLHGGRHNHCPTSPVYRDKCVAINSRLAERYKDHPALILWHVSNEYGGECHCELCKEAFRRWLRERYHDDLDELNHAWWGAFWSRAYGDWSQIADPHLHMLDWKRFVTHQTIDFFLAESAPLRRITPQVPVTTNFMGTYPGLDYWQFARHVDVACWDSYPHWHGPEGDEAAACHTAFVHDINRCLKGGRPFLLMESQPGVAKGRGVWPRKRPGMHALSSLQAVAHGSDSVLYFQWRKGRGGYEKHHGAVVDHVGTEHTRTFRDVAELGRLLGRLDDVVGTAVPTETALVYDWENRWAIDEAQCVGDALKRYEAACLEHYRPFWRRGVPVDVIDQTCPLEGYRLVVAPLLYMLRGDVAERLGRFVRSGGTLVVTYGCGFVDGRELCFLGGWPGGGLREVLGVWNEETDTLYPGQSVAVACRAGNPLGLAGTYRAVDVCARLHAEGAEAVAEYAEGLFAGTPAVTVHGHGRGRAYYVACRGEGGFLDDFYAAVARGLGLRRALEADLPDGVTAQLRTDGAEQFVFLLNFSAAARAVALPRGTFHEVLAGRDVAGRAELGPYGAMVLRRGRVSPRGAAEGRSRRRTPPRRTRSSRRTRSC